MHSYPALRRRCTIAVTSCLAVVPVLLLLGGTARSLAAQTTTHLFRGRVTTSGAPVTHARVTVTDIVSHLSHTTATDDDGRYTVPIQNGSGRYTLAVAAIGFAPDTQSVVLAPGETTRVTDVTMTVRTLDRVTVVGRSSPRGGNSRNNTGRPVDSIAANAATALDEGTGDLLSTLAGTMPGVTITPGANGDTPTFSVLGTPAAQNTMTLDGTRFTDGVIPPDALGAVHLVVSPYDPAMGNFSGGQLSVSTRQGTNTPFRSLHLTLAEPSLTFPNAATLATSPPHSNLQLSLAAGGAIVPNHLFYFGSLQSSRQAADAPTLLDATAPTLQHAGIAPDSVARTVQLLANDGISATANGLPSSTLRTTTSGILRLDLARSATSSTTLTFLGSHFDYDGIGLSPLSTPTQALSFARSTARVQLASSDYFGTSILQELHASVSDVTRTLAPALLTPAGSVLVGSVLTDGTPTLSTLAFGGADNASASTTTAYDVNDAISWMTPGNTHTVQLTGDVTHQHRHALSSSNVAGTFVYPSLDALAANMPSSFTRATGATAVTGGTTTFSASLGDTWRPTHALQIQYGARADLQWFSDVPRYNAAIDSAFGVRNDAVPRPVGLSPRLGFTYQMGSSAKPVPGSHATASTALISSTQLTGGIGAFRGQLDPSLLTSAASATGLPGSVAQLTCVGAAVPAVQWASYLDHPNLVPTQCADGSGALPFATVQPSVTFLTPDLQPPTSWRASLGWQGTVARRWNLEVDGTYALGLHQLDPINLNFTGTPGFVLANEGNRPVFVAPSAIVPATGVIAPTSVERDTTFGVVTSDAADLRSITKQVTVTASPKTSATWGSYSVSYTYTAASDQSRGFSSSRGGDPMAVEWAPGGA
ncbi:MAG TPA: carboxypeptidase-like regulatory domain-containing protein, partial [Gemmatimonadaceae bacterium]|nr:carboxypeptidase-like regulatory domain-containing protein [Gemmatimonadaceae bacterium]